MEKGQYTLVRRVGCFAAKDVAFVGIHACFAGEVFELAEADELAGVDDRDLPILLAVKDEKRRQVLHLREKLVGEKARPFRDGFDAQFAGTGQQRDRGPQALSDERNFPGTGRRARASIAPATSSGPAAPANSNISGGPITR